MSSYFLIRANLYKKAEDESQVIHWLVHRAGHPVLSAEGKAVLLTPYEGVTKNSGESMNKDCV